MGFEGYEEHSSFSTGGDVSQSKQSLLNDGYKGKECSIQHVPLNLGNSNPPAVFEIQITSKPATCAGSAESIPILEAKEHAEMMICEPNGFGHVISEEQSEVSHKTSKTKKTQAADEKVCSNRPKFSPTFMIHLRWSLGFLLIATHLNQRN